MHHTRAQDAQLVADAAYAGRPDQLQTEEAPKETLTSRPESSDESQNQHHRLCVAWLPLKRLIQLGRHLLEPSFQLLAATGDV